jgi:hypothetical protein
VVDHEGRQLVFILSTPRAGSTLLAALLGSHSQVLCPPEPWLLLSLSAIRTNDSDSLITSHYDHELARKALNELVEKELFCEAANAFALTIYNSLLDRAGKQVFVDKTPRYYHILPWLEALFPLARKIWIKRNPLDVVASRKDRGFTIEESVGDVLSPYSFDTTIGFALLASYFEMVSPTKHILHYEDLVQDAVPTIKAICEFLELPFEEHMLAYGANQVLMKMYADATMGDEKILEHMGPHTHSVGRWRDMLTPQEISQVVHTLGRDLFVRLGYRDILEEAAERAGVNPDDIDEKGKLGKLFQQYASYVDKELSIAKGIQHTRITRQNAHLQERNDHLQERNDHLQERNDHLQERNAQLQERNAQLQERNAHLQERNAQLEEHNAQLQECNVQLHFQNDELQTKLSQQLAELSQMRNSWIWRITAPFRKVPEVLKR